MSERRNIVQEVREPGGLDRILHAKKRSFFSVIRRLLAHFTKDPKRWGMLILGALAGSLQFLLTAFAARAFIGLLEKLRFGALSPVAEVVGMSAGFAFTFFVLSSVRIQAEVRSRAWQMEERLGYFVQVSQKMRKMEYGLFEDANFQAELWKWNEAVSGTNTGVEGCFGRVLPTLESLLTTVFLGALFIPEKPLLPLVVLVAGLLGVGIRSAYDRAWYRKQELLSKISAQLGRLQWVSTDFHYGKDLRIFRLGDRFDTAYAEKRKEIGDFYARFRRKQYGYSLLAALAFGLAEIGSARFFGNTGVGQGNLSTIVFWATAFSIFTAQWLTVCDNLIFFRKESYAIVDLFDFLEAELAPTGGATLSCTPGSPVDLRLEHVYFRYPGSEKWVLEDVNLHIPKGQSVALVGVNGAGKSTLVHVLMGLYRPDRGRVLIDNIDATTLSAQTLFEIFGAVFQEGQPLALTVAENIAGVDAALPQEAGGIDRARVIAVLDAVGLREKIESFPKGIDMPMSKELEEDGILLSGGETQKLMIARALYKPTTGALLLDEPTAALDALAEEAIYRSFEALTAGRTALFISHRLASTRFCDCIALLDGGQIVQKGTHEELMNEEGLYRTLYETQAKYYREEGRNENV
uniref:ATP-binding cassette domain-containing protein n=1 Tax=Ndongobacter massiliensis TaxID=1871025 RepID=UPI00093033A9|nr:ABC transporter ATP-binding protein [Ndongobacter massiliensis]